MDNKLNPKGTLILTRSEIAGLMSFADYVDAVEHAFRLLAANRIMGPGILDLAGIDGMFHAKAAGMPADDDVYMALKMNGNFPENKKRFGLPTIQGTIILFDGMRGYPLAILDSTEITIQRTGAATAIAAKHLARPNSKTAMIFGCGKQGEIQLKALKHVLPISRAFAVDQDSRATDKFCTAMSSQLGFAVTAAHEVKKATQDADVIVTCTTSRKSFLTKDQVAPGTFVAAVGADSHDKQEVDPELMASSKVVTDILEQCSRIGDLHHAIQSKKMSIEDVYAQLHEIVSGQKKGRSSEDETFIFDSTGTAVQDVAAAAIVYRRALEQGAGTFIDLMES
jgi:alanine dehydrogenase